jgi:hypothetical protein
MLKTHITEQYGLKVPFINAGMAFIATAPLVRAAAQGAGGPLRRAAALRARGARDTVLTPRAPERGARIGPMGAIHPYPVWDQPRRT